jgi:YHS domain-containing protein
MRGIAALAAGCAFTVASRPTTAQQAALAIKGYDPVAYFVDGRPVRGLPEIAYEWDEHRYWFSSAQHREFFRADPVRYAPQFANFCAMSLAKGELVEADPESWLINADKLYIFGKREGPDLFRQDLAGNIAKSNQNRSLIGAH